MNTYLNSTVSADVWGVHLDQHLNWRPFIRGSDKWPNSDCFQISVLNNFVDFKTRNIFYYAQTLINR